MGLKILLADDSPHAQRDGSRILTELGYEVSTVSNGSAALKKFEEDPPDLLIADTSMPGLSGLEICQRIKDQPRWAGIPVLLALAAFELYDAEQGRQVGADAVIQKPFIPSALEKTVQELLIKAGKIAPEAPHPEPAAMPASPEDASPQPEAGATPTPAEEPAAASAPEAPAAPDSSAAEPPAPEPAVSKPRWQVEEVAIHDAVAASAFAPAAAPEPAASAQPAAEAEPHAAAAAASATFSMPPFSSDQAFAPEPPAPAWHWPGNQPAPAASVAPAAGADAGSVAVGAPAAAPAGASAAADAAGSEAAQAHPADDDLLLGALREFIVEPAPASPTAPRVDLEAVLTVLDEVLAQYLAPMMADEVKDQISRRLRQLE